MALRRKAWLICLRAKSRVLGGTTWLSHCSGMA
jgi:hypothetical protein